jgi:hypothetical protein
MATESCITSKEEYYPHMKLCCLFCIVIATLVSVARAYDDNPSLSERYDSLPVSNLELNHDSLDKALRKLTETMGRDMKGRLISIALVSPSEELLRKSITKKFENKTLKYILEELCIIADLHYSLDHHAVIIAEKSVNISKRGLRVGTPRTNETLETGMRISLPDLMISGMTITDAAKAIQEKARKYNATGKPFILQSKAEGAPKVYAWFPIIATGEAIEYICLSARLKYSSPQEGVYIIINR